MSVHVVHVVWGFGTGGMERGIARVIRHGSPEFRHSVLILTPPGTRPWQIPTPLPEGTPRIDLNKQSGNSPRFIWRLSRELKALKPDIIHTRNWAGMDGIIGARLAGIRGVVHGEHGWNMEDLAGRRKRALARRVLQRWVREFTCVSKDIERWLRDDVGIKRPITQIYNGVNTDRLQPGDGGEVRAELEIPADAFLVGIVGRLAPIKDHPTLFRAVAAARAQGADVHVLVVGGGQEDERLHALAGEGVHLLSHRDDVPSILRALDCYALTSLNEGISNTILEAMATALPVVATRVGGNPELVEDGVTGRLIEAGDADGFASAFGAYAADRSLAVRHGAAGRAAAISKYSVAAMVAGYEAVWARVAS